ncbi:MAG: MYG1 family protein [Alphaproteobacteria bacterium]|nr:MYG1 family protein [Alphaproteobacteria bacterium]
MALTVGTHSGTFHADDVLAFALLRAFVDDEATVVRTRDPEVLDTCDVVVDVGGSYDPEARRFDHHQGTYRGPRSSAGMVLDWLESSGTVTADLAHHLRHRMVDYIDAVDTGREAPRVDVPCFARMVEAIGDGTDTAQDQQDAFLVAAGIGRILIDGLVAGHERVCEARAAVRRAMDEAVRDGRSVIFLDRYHPWKPVYFEYGGREHPTDFVLFPSEDATWKVVAIPPELGCFDQKRPLPASWAGKMREELEAATGIPGSVFCHKNRFIAVFSTKEGAIEALKREGLYAARPAAPAGCGSTPAA